VDPRDAEMAARGDLSLSIVCAAEDRAVAAWPQRRCGVGCAAARLLSGGARRLVVGGVCAIVDADVPAQRRAYGGWAGVLRAGRRHGWPRCRSALVHAAGALRQ